MQCFHDAAQIYEQGGFQKAPSTENPSLDCRRAGRRVAACMVRTSSSLCSSSHLRTIAWCSSVHLPILVWLPLKDLMLSSLICCRDTTANTVHGIIGSLISVIVAAAVTYFFGFSKEQINGEK